LQFNSSGFLSLGLELELQIINNNNYDLTPQSPEFIRNFSGNMFDSQLKPEITQSMIEINSSVHTHPDSLLLELQAIRDSLINNSSMMNVHVSGGGTHHFQMWHDRKIYPDQHYKNAAKKYGYLAKMFTVFGMHIHLGCSNGDDAMYLMNTLARYIPHFIALSASSPFSQGVDTGYDSARGNVVQMFPLSGLAPSVTSWSDFCNWMDNVKHLDIASGINNFYWDIRPKPEYGTIEIRVCDTPLTIERAVEIAAYAQCLAHFLLTERSLPYIYHDPLIYNCNRYESSYNSFQATFINPYTIQTQLLKDDMLETLALLKPHAKVLANESYLAAIEKLVDTESNDAKILRDHFKKSKSLNSLMKWQSHLFADQKITYDCSL
jgi:carboxylate-amine ligase